jgi:hypothetical protein
MIGDPFPVVIVPIYTYKLLFLVLYIISDNEKGWHGLPFLNFSEYLFPYCLNGCCLGIAMVRMQSLRAVEFLILAHFLEQRPCLTRLMK